MRLTDETTANGITERQFELDVAGERVPGVLWTPDAATGPRPLLLMGHGGSQHKKAERLLARAHGFVRRLGYAVAAIDAPGHGDRATPEQRAQYAETLRQRIERRGSGLSPEVARQLAERARVAVPEWRATLAALRELDEVGADGPVGYWGVSMGTLIGVPFVAEEPRIVAAVFGLSGLLPDHPGHGAAAAKITIPIEFVLQWDDNLVPREHGLGLYDAFGSSEKSLHVNPGGHVETPDFEAAGWAGFFQRHLGRAS